MTALIIGLLLIAFTVFSVLAMGLNWGKEVLLVLKGGIPILAVFIGLIAVFIGIADIKDKIESKKEEQEDATEDASTPKEEKGET